MPHPLYSPNKCTQFLSSLARIPSPSIGVRNNQGFLKAAALASAEMLFSQAATRCQHFREFLSREPGGGSAAPGESSAPPAPPGMSRSPSGSSWKMGKVEGSVSVGRGGKNLHWRCRKSIFVGGEGSVSIDRKSVV